MWNKKVICKECKCWLSKNDAQEIETRGLINRKDYFCQAHKVNYDNKYAGWQGTTYTKNMIVESDGEPIGYTKNKIK